MSLAPNCIIIFFFFFVFNLNFERNFEKEKRFEGELKATEKPEISSFLVRFRQLTTLTINPSFRVSLFLKLHPDPTRLFRNKKKAT